MKSKNVFVTAVCPGGMNTTPMLILQNKSQKGLGRWSIMDPEEVAKIAIDGMIQKREVIIPGFWNKLFMLFDKILPKWYKEMLTEGNMRKSKAFSDPVTFSIHQLKTAV